MPHQSLEDAAARMPERSGVYLFRDKNDRVLYVGKAKVLRARVRQYLAGHDPRAMVRLLVEQAVTVDAVLTDTEKEALILESTLIKRYLPPYNVRLRDDKHFLHLRLDMKQPWPRFELVRKVRDDGARYQGPFSSAQSARSTLTFLQRAFPLRTCTDQVMKGRSRPCLLHQLGRCVAPCVPGHTTPEAYRELIDQALLLVSGRDQELIQRLKDRMFAAAEGEDFEEAARLRDLVKEIEGTLERQKVADPDLADRDVWGVFLEGDRGVAAIIPVREGKMLEPEYLEFDDAPGEPGERLSSWLNAWYGEGALIPPELLLPLEPSGLDALTEVLRERRGGAFRVRLPQRGEKARLQRLAADNARDRFRRRNDVADRRRRALEELATLLNLAEPPHRIECFDNSNFQGTNPVASCVVFIDGAPEKKHYRHYKIKTVVGADDFATMNEILERRFRRAAEEGVFPDLVVVDGGKGQLSAARAALAELGFEDQAIIGLSKPRTERRKGEHDAVDKIVLPDQDELLRLPDHDPALNLLRQLRDEAHRFAITFHRQVRKTSTFTSALDALPGVGPTRKKALLRHLGSMKAVMAADLPSLADVPGIGPQLAWGIWSALHPDETPADNTAPAAAPSAAEAPQEP
jgi:excinuclease ABC subunit C